MMLRFLNSALLAFSLIAATAGHAAEVTPLPVILPDEVESLTVADLEARMAKGDLKAQAELGARYARGGEVEVDLRKAISLLDRAARKNEPNAQYYLGTAYSTGIGVKQNPKEAANWFKKAADKSHAGGQYSYAVMLANGQGGLKADPARAAEYMRKSAEQGFVMAGYEMAQFHLAGLGVPKSPEQAAYWYRRVLKTTKHNPSHIGLMVLVESGETKWQPGDPFTPAEEKQESAAGIIASTIDKPLLRRMEDLVAEPERSQTFKTDSGVTFTALLKAGVMKVTGTSEKPYNCEVVIKFTFLDVNDERREGTNICFGRSQQAGKDITICESVHPNFVQTKVESLETRNCREP